MAVYGKEDDLVIALREATKAITANGRFDQVAQINGDDAAAFLVTEVADIYVAWLRQVRSIKLALVAKEEQTSEVVATFTQGGTSVSAMDTSQQLRYVIESADDRGFAVDTTLTVTVSDPAVVSATILEATGPEGTASGKDELLVVAIAPGSAMVTVADPANAEVFGSDSVDVVAGGVAAVVLSTPVVEEQPAPAPEPEPAPEPAPGE